MWRKSHFINETSEESLLGSEITFEHRLREIEQERIILNCLQENFKEIEIQRGKKR
jgi:hypothetical protein